MAGKQTMYQHVHMGAGAFGLGFVVPLVAQDGFQTVLTNRTRGSTTHVHNMAIKANAGYDLVLRGAHTKTEPIPITEFVFLDEDKDRFLEVVADPKTSLLTTALRQGFRSSIPILAEALANRLQTGAKERLYVIACESPTIGDSNDLRRAILSEHPKLASRDFGRRISFIPCIVDRICNEPILDEVTGQVSVETEEFAEWLLQGPSPLEDILLTQSAQESISFVSDLAPFARRKTWLVNGPHLLIALRAFVQHEKKLDLFLATDEGKQLLSVLMREAQRAFLSVESFFSKSELTRYTKRIQARFSTFPDSTIRHLPRLARSRMDEFMADFYKKSGVIQLPHGQAHQRMPFQTALTLLLTTELVATDHYAYDDSGRAIPFGVD